MSLCVDGSLVCIPDGRPHRLTYTRYRVDTVNSADDGHMVARNMYRIEINITWKICASSWFILKDVTWIEEWKTNLMSLAILFQFFCAQHVSDINISIIRNLRLCCWITTSIVLFCKDGWFSVSVNLRCIVVCVWCDVFCLFVVVGRRILIDIDRYLFALTLNHPSLQNKTTNVVIQQHIRKLLMMDILMSETYWAHKKWNKIASDINLVFHSSTIAMMHGPINIRFYG